MSSHRQARTLNPLFETSRRKYANRTAVRYGEETLKYRDLMVDEPTDLVQRPDGDDNHESPQSDLLTSSA